MSDLAICVYGAPAPQGSKKHLGNGVMVESSKAVKPWREAVKYAAILVRGRMPAMTGPVNVLVCFTVPKPASAPKTRVTYPSKRPDIDKLIRSTFDALGDAGCWLDDGQVVQVTATKAYPNEAANALDTPGARIWITSVVA